MLNATWKHNGSTTNIWDDRFYCLIVDLLTGFDPCQKWLMVKLVLTLNTKFLENVTIGIFVYETKSV